VRGAGVTALAVLIVTAALAVLLAVVFHLAWPPVVVAILGTLPTLYLAWLAVPGVINPPDPRCREQAGLWPPGGVVGSGGAGRAQDDRLRPDAGGPRTAGRPAQYRI
jgi:hypothetical protein